LLRQYSEPSVVVADAVKPERSQALSHRKNRAPSYDEVIHQRRFFQENFLFVFAIAMLFILAVFAAVLALAA